MKKNVTKTLAWVLFCCFLGQWLLPQAAAGLGDEAAAAVRETVQDKTERGQKEITLTVDLNGGQANGLVTAGWTKTQGSSYQWERKAARGTSLELDSTLGGLLPESPYRVGCTWEGWDNAGTMTLQEDTLLTAQWKETFCTVEFRQGTEVLWKVSVPYGAVLWTGKESPWTGENVMWNDENQAEVSLSGEGEVDSVVTVTRFQTEESYYYTFTYNKVFYFTYGGKLPALDRYFFQGWRQTGSGNGFAVLNDTNFTALFQAVATYVFHVYYYYQSGSRVNGLETQSVTLYETDIKQGVLSFAADIKPVAYSKGAMGPLPAGVSIGEETGGRIPVAVEVDTAFGNNTSATKFMALRVVYQPAEIAYSVEYYHQNPAADSYEKAGELLGLRAFYGSRIVLQDRPELPGVSFDGFQVSARSRDALSQGVLLEEGQAQVEFVGNYTAVVKVYYDRASYFIYFQTGTTEVQLEPSGFALGRQSLSWRRIWKNCIERDIKR